MANILSECDFGNKGSCPLKQQINIDLAEELRVEEVRFARKSKNSARRTLSPVGVGVVASVAPMQPMEFGSLLNPVGHTRHTYGLRRSLLVPYIFSLSRWAHACLSSLGSLLLQKGLPSTVKTKLQDKTPYIQGNLVFSFMLCLHFASLTEKTLRNLFRSLFKKILLS